MTTEKNGSQKPTSIALTKTTPDLPSAKEESKSAPLSETKQTAIASSSDNSTAPPTKMEVATEIFNRMRSTSGVTRKQIIDQFVADARLSKAGASTYYQLIKAKSK